MVAWWSTHRACCKRIWKFLVIFCFGKPDTWLAWCFSKIWCCTITSSYCFKWMSFPAYFSCNVFLLSIQCSINPALFCSFFWQITQNFGNLLVALLGFSLDFCRGRTLPNSCWLAPRSRSYFHFNLSLLVDHDLDSPHLSIFVELLIDRPLVEHVWFLCGYFSLGIFVDYAHMIDLWNDSEHFELKVQVESWFSHLWKSCVIGTHRSVSQHVANTGCFKS